LVRKRKPRKSKKKVEEEATYTQSDVKKLEPVTEEEPIIVSQPFTDPTQTEEINVMPGILAEVPESTETPFKPEELINLTDKYRRMDAETEAAIAELPEALLNPTQRQHMTEFYPTYSRIRSKLRRLAGL